MNDLKKELHPNNKHRGRYDFPALIASSPELEQHVNVNPYGDLSVNFFDPEAVKSLNRALLIHFYGLEYWDIPAAYLCPPIPGRADYVHYLADLLPEDKLKTIRGLDIGTGANCIYPIIGAKEYNWQFVGTEVDPTAVESAQKIVSENTLLQGVVEIRKQENNAQFFNGIIQAGEFFDFTICNPPFHASLEEAQAGSRRKESNLCLKEVLKPTLNFGGQTTELWYEGGELKFIQEMIKESTDFTKQVGFFSTLVSKQSNVDPLFKTLKQCGYTDTRLVEMAQGHKISRFIAWTK